MIRFGFLVVPVLLVLASFEVACAQKSLTQVTNEDEISVKFTSVFKNGETGRYAVKFEEIPNAGVLPTGYVPLTAKSFLIRSTAIFSDAIATINAPVSPEVEFKKVRILMLTRNELVPRGFEWKDCTVLPKRSEDIPAKVQLEQPQWIQYFKGYNETMAKFMHDFVRKKVSCEMDGYEGSGDRYLTVIRLAEPAPTVPFTQITSTVEVLPAPSSTSEIAYRLILKNAGNKDAAELNFYSRFDSDFGLVSVKPSQGGCGPSMRSGGTAVCHLGSLAAGRSATVELVAVPTPGGGSSNPLKPGPANESWSVDGFAKERPADPHWMANHFEFQPLKRRD